MVTIFRVLLASIAAVLVAGGCGDVPAESEGAAEPVRVPELVGLSLSDADDLAAGLELDASDASEDDRMILVRGNWTVVAQDPAPGSDLDSGGSVSVSVLKEGEAAPGDTEPLKLAPDEGPTTTATPPPSTEPPPPPPTEPPPSPRRESAESFSDRAYEEPAEPGAYYENCSAARDAGAAPVRRGDPGYGDHLDRDGDGVGCE